MLNVGIIGIGNTGNQIAALAKKRLNIPVIAINSSDKDLATLPQDIPTRLIQDADGLSSGAGKDRKLAKKYLKDSIVNLMQDSDFVNMIADLDFVYVVSSTGGGTGSGTAPIVANILSEAFKDVKCILVGVLPVNGEEYDSHVNTIEYLEELYNKLSNQTYMLYDNDKLSDLPSYELLQKVNEEVVSDIDVMRCMYNYQTQYASIDDRDMTRLLSFPGRIMLARLEGFLEKDCDNQTIEDMIIDKIKRNAHVESQRDKKIMASGIITNLSESLTREFDDNLPEVKKFVGEPVHGFIHTSINTDRKMPNNVFYIATGLTPINDKINKINDRIEEIQERQKVLEEESALAEINVSKLSESIADNTEDDSEETRIDVDAIFGKFDM